MARSQGKYDLVNLALGGRLDEILRSARERGESYDTIARSFDENEGIQVSYETIRRWCGERGIVPATSVA